MIKINLLPQEMVGGGRATGAAAGGAGTLLVALILIVLFGFDIAVGSYLYLQQKEKEDELADVKRQLTSVQEELDNTELEYNQTKMDIERMEKLIKVAEALDPTDRLLWARKLNMLPSLVPEGVYLTGINVTQKVVEKETEESLAARNAYLQNRGENKGPMPPIVKIPVITQTLQLNAIAYVPEGTSTQRLQQLNAFYKNLQTERIQVPFDREPKLFMQGFQPVIQPSALLGKRLEGREVSEFSFTLNTIPLEIR